MNQEETARRLNAAGWNWLSSAQKYVPVGRHGERPRYWIAPFAKDRIAVETQGARGFSSLRALQAWLKDQDRV